MSTVSKPFLVSGSVSCSIILASVQEFKLALVSFDLDDSVKVVTKESSDLSTFSLVQRPDPEISHVNLLC